MLSIKNKIELLHSPAQSCYRYPASLIEDVSSCHVSLFLRSLTHQSEGYAISSFLLSTLTPGTPSGANFHKKLYPRPKVDYTPTRLSQGGGIPEVITS